MSRPARPPNNRAVTSDAQPPVVVVVEDDPGMRLAITRILGLGGFLVHAFDSAEACARAGGIESAACLVVDLRLPGQSGFEFYETLRAKGSSPPVVFITAIDDEPVRDRARRLGGSFLPKPFSGRSLIASVSEAIASTG